MDLRALDPSAAATAVRSAWALGDHPLPNLVHLMEAHGIRVYSLVEECAALDGFSFWYDGAPFVFLTYHKSAERARWDAAHELGHLVLHQGLPPKGRETEAEADSFAAEFLLPESGVRARRPFPALNEIRREKLYWRVSAVGYIRRLHQLGLISQRQYKSLIIEASQAGYRRREGDIEHETSQLATKILVMLREDGIRVSDVAAELDVAPAEVRGLLFNSLATVGTAN
jgi:Zn-dependent peptidase ImmA (M78 family)